MSDTNEPVLGSAKTDARETTSVADELSHRPLHLTVLEFIPAIPAEMEVGTELSFALTVACASGCDLTGTTVLVTSDSIAGFGLTRFDHGVNATEQLALSAPSDLGEFVWTAVLPRQAGEHLVHEEGSVSATFRTRPHRTSMAVWDVPSPVVLRTSFTVKVGIKCDRGCALTGDLIEIRDEAGTKVGEGRLSAVPWPGSDSLYWATITVAGPPGEGVFFWKASLVPGTSGLAHDVAEAAFSCRVERPPEHIVNVEVSAATSGRPIADVEVRVGHYQASTNSSGIATLAVPTGPYEISIRKDGLGAAPVATDIDCSVTIPIHAHPAVSKALAESPVGPHHPYRD